MNATLRDERLSLDLLAARVGGRLPRTAIDAVLTLLLKERCLSLCLHRVTHDARDEGALSVRAERLDELLTLLLARRPGAGWLTVTLDDGYDDAAQYVATRAARFPAVEFLVFVCPQKLVQRAGFRWDAGVLPDEPFDLVMENSRPELRALGDQPAYQLATVQTLQALQALPNVALGNHTNVHADARKLEPGQAAQDYAQSTRDFTALFGAPLHFAFPFGTPGLHFDASHVAALNELTPRALLWTTGAGTFDATERTPGAVLPRCPIVGEQSVAELTGWLALKLLGQRLRPQRSRAHVRS
jgi:hypothetical protein